MESWCRRVYVLGEPPAVVSPLGLGFPGLQKPRPACRPTEALQWRERWVASPAGWLLQLGPPGEKAAREMCRLGTWGGGDFSSGPSLLTCTSGRGPTPVLWEEGPVAGAPRPKGRLSKKSLPRSCRLRPIQGGCPNPVWPKRTRTVPPTSQSGAGVSGGAGRGEPASASPGS